MGSRNPDRIPLAARRSRAETAGEQLAQGWKLRTRCLTCRIELEGDLRVVVAVMGPSFKLWGKRTRCRKVGCRGKAVFQAMAPGMAYFEEMSDTARPKEDPAWLTKNVR